MQLYASYRFKLEEAQRLLGFPAYKSAKGTGEEQNPARRKQKNKPKTTPPPSPHSLVVSFMMKPKEGF